MSRVAASFVVGIWVSLSSLGVTRAGAQQPGTCRFQLDSAGIGRQDQVGPGRIHTFASGGVHARCLGQRTEMFADSAASYSELDRVDFVGHVVFRDTSMQLTADRANYFPSSERVDAYGNVRLENTVSKSVLTGPQLTYYRVAPGVRDTAELEASRRPTVEYRVGGDTATPPYDIVADRVRMRGQETAWALGRVVVTREKFRAAADSAELHFERGTGVLLGHAQAARADSAGYTIRGRRLDFRLANNSLQWVQAVQGAEATSADWRVIGDTISFDLADDHIQGGTAWGDSTRAEAFSERQTITADSLAIDAPDQVLTELRAFGRARAVTHADTTTDITDWVLGDTVVARFDSAATGGRELRQLEAVGNAAALYHIYEEDDRQSTPAINYARGQRLTALMRGDALERVDVVDQADGVYLEPKRSTPP